MSNTPAGTDLLLCREDRPINYRKDWFTVRYHYYQHPHTGEQTTAPELDALNEVQAQNQYRVKYGIPFPEEMKAIRESYGVSATLMSEILGFGTHSCRLYEIGEMPSVSNGRLIKAVADPKEFLKQVKASEQMIGAEQMDRITKRVNELAGETNFNAGLDGLLNFPISAFTGYRKLNLNKVTHAISYFSALAVERPLYKTKLNKMLFYFDYGCYKRTGYSAMGLPYSAIQYGPVPSVYEMLFLKLAMDDKIEIRAQLTGEDNYAEVFHGKVAFESNVFSHAEMEVLQNVANNFTGYTTGKIVALSHEESAWINNKDTKNNVINYQEHAFGLKHL